MAYFRGRLCSNARAAAPRTLFFGLNGLDPRACALGYFPTLPTGASCALNGDDALGEHLLDSPQRLAGALFVLDEGEADVVVAVVAEADAGTQRGSNKPTLEQRAFAFSGSLGWRGLRTLKQTR
jgi:hypothetical protein